MCRHALLSPAPVPPRTTEPESCIASQMRCLRIYSAPPRAPSRSRCQGYPGVLWPTARAHSLGARALSSLYGVCGARVKATLAAMPLWSWLTASPVACLAPFCSYALSLSSRPAHGSPFAYAAAVALAPSPQQSAPQRSATATALPHTATAAGGQRTRHSRPANPSPGASAQRIAFASRRA